MQFKKISTILVGFWIASQSAFAKDLESDENTDFWKPVSKQEKDALLQKNESFRSKAESAISFCIWKYSGPSFLTWLKDARPNSPEDDSYRYVAIPVPFVDGKIYDYEVKYNRVMPYRLAQRYQLWGYSGYRSESGQPGSIVVSTFGDFGADFQVLEQPVVGGSPRRVVVDPLEQNGASRIWISAALKSGDDLNRRGATVNCHEN